MRKIKWFQDPNQFYAIYNQLMISRPKSALSAHLFYSLPLEDTVYESVCGQVPGLSGIIERGKAESPHFENIIGRQCRELIHLRDCLAFHAEEVNRIAKTAASPITLCNPTPDKPGSCNTPVCL